jgi:hypothetical protein
VGDDVAVSMPPPIVAKARARYINYSSVPKAKLLTASASGVTARLQRFLRPAPGVVAKYLAAGMEFF